MLPVCLIEPSSSVPNDAFTLSPNSNALSVLSHKILPDDPIRVTSSFNVEVPETSTLALISTLPPYVETPATFN